MPTAMDATEVEDEPITKDATDVDAVPIAMDATEVEDVSARPLQLVPVNLIGDEKAASVL